jgi:hypothetical protein
MKKNIGLLLLALATIAVICVINHHDTSEEVEEKAYYIHAFYTNGKVIPNVRVKESNLRVKIDSLYETEMISHVLISICNNQISNTDNKKPGFSSVDTTNEFYGDGIMGKFEPDTQ